MTGHMSSVIRHLIIYDNDVGVISETRGGVDIRDGPVCSSDTQFYNVIFSHTETGVFCLRI